MNTLAGAGTFWLASTPDRTSNGVLTSEDVRWHLAVDESLFDSANLPSSVQIGDEVCHTYSPDPSMDVLDSLPRVIHGRLNDGSMVTLFDAQEAGTNWNPLLGTKKQDFGGWRALVGAALPDMEALANGVRWTLPPIQGLQFAGEAACQGGTLSSYANEEGRGVCLVIDRHEPLQSLVELTPNRISTLLAIACGVEVQPLHREIRLPDGSWIPFGVDRKAPTSLIRPDLVPAGTIDLERLAVWTDQTASLGPLPFIAARNVSTTLQSDVQTLAAALEGLHRRLHADERPFGKVTSKGVGRAIAAAATAGMEQLSAEGWEHPDIAKTRFQEALNHVGQMSYADRLKVLLLPVQQVAPGLFGPDLDEWVKAIKVARNVQSHQLDTHDDFGEREIALYFVLGQSAAWALRIALLLTVLPGAKLREGLRHSSRFIYSLANIDAERVWKDYSCTAAFRRANATTLPLP